jgi:hypothetical protein
MHSAASLMVGTYSFESSISLLIVLSSYNFSAFFTFKYL